MDAEYQKIEEGHVAKIEQAMALLQEVLQGEKKEIGEIEEKPSLKDELKTAMLEQK